MNIKITDKAKEMIRETIDKKGVSDPVIRIYIAGFGWGGPNFGIVLDEQKENDYKVKEDDISYVVEKDLIKKYGGFIVDYSKTWLYKGFRVQAQYGGSGC